MPRPDEALKEFLGDDKVYAAIFNGYFFNGKNVIDSENLERADTAYAKSVTANTKIEKINKYRDNVRRTSLGYFVILAIEDQDKIHYAMPIRKMLYDVLGYSTEVTALGNIQDNRNWTVDEKLSKVAKGTKVTPIVTVVLYTGEAKWDGPRTLHDMMDISEELRPFVPDYPLYVIDIGHDENLTFPNDALEELRVTLSAIYADTADQNETEIDGSIMALAGILAGDYKLYKAANYDGRQRMCKVLEARDERIRREYEEEKQRMCKVLQERDERIRREYEEKQKVLEERGEKIRLEYEEKQKVLEERGEKIRRKKEEKKKVLEERGEKIIRKTEEETAKKKELEAVKNMISFEVPEEKILSKYSKSIYDEALKLVEQENSEPKEM